MNRQVILSNKAVQYSHPTAVKSVVLILHDTAQIGTDLTAIEAVAFISRLKNSLDNPKRAVIALQLQTGQTGYWSNSLDPAFAYIATAFPGLPIDVIGFGIGGGNIITDLTAYASKIRSVACIAAAPSADSATKLTLSKIYTYFVYAPSDPTTNVISFTDAVVAALHASPYSVANYVCQAGQYGKAADRNAWDVFVSGLYGDGVTYPQFNLPAAATYWYWLDNTVDLDVAHIRPDVFKSVYVNGVKKHDGAVDGDPIKVEIY
jgi:hypothetical protein